MYSSILAKISVFDVILGQAPKLLTGSYTASPHFLSYLFIFVKIVCLPRSSGVRNQTCKQNNQANHVFKRD